MDLKNERTRLLMLVRYIALLESKTQANMPNAIPTIKKMHPHKETILLDNSRNIYKAPAVPAYAIISSIFICSINLQEPHYIEYTRTMRV